MAVTMGPKQTRLSERKLSRPFHLVSMNGRLQKGKETNGLFCFVFFTLSSAVTIRARVMNASQGAGGLCAHLGTTAHQAV